MRATVVRVGVVLAVLPVSGCSGLFSTYDGPELVSNVSAGVAQTTSGAALPTYGSFYVGDLCLSEEGEVTISDVELLDPFGDAEVSGFSTFAFRSGTLGFDLARIDDVPDYRGGTTVDVTCDDEERITSLAVEVVKPHARPAGGRGLRVSYESTAGTSEVEVAFEPVLCDDFEDDGCETG